MHKIIFDEKAKDLLKNGLITLEEKDALVSEAAESDVGI